MKDIIVFKNANKEGNQPDYRVVAKNENDELTEVAALWKSVDENGNPKQDKNGNPFLTGKMKDAYQDKPGFSIQKEEQKEEQKADVNDVEF